MIERNGSEGYTAAYMTADWEPADAESAALIKLVYDDGRVMILTNPDATKPEMVSKATKADPLEPGARDDDTEHEHDGSAWSRHRIRTGQKKTLRVHGRTLASWARDIAAQDAQRIHTAISVGLTAGEDNTDIAHRVIGSRRLNGSNGATEITRQHILHLGRGLLHKRKSRMSGA